MAVDGRRDPDSYAAELSALLPMGFAWPRDPDTVLAGVLAGLAAGLAEADGRLWDLLAEADPRSSLELLPDWERLCGLPDACLGDIAQTVAERRAAVVGRLTATGGASIAYFTAVAATVGRTIAIEEFRPLRAGCRAGARCYGVAWAFAWRVRLLDIDTSTSWMRAGQMRAGDPIRTGAAIAATWGRAGTLRAGDRIVTWRDRVLECLLRRLAPAHTLPLFAYGDGEGSA